MLVSDIEIFYAENEAFHMYVTEFCKFQKKTVAEALECAVVIETYKMYKKIGK